MRSLLAAVSVVVVLFGAGLGAASAWNDTGHQVISLIAWGTMSERTRGTVVALMRQAPGGAGLASLFAQDNRPLAVRQREFFRRASTWPDIVRSEQPAARHAFHRPTWHHRSFFWRQEAAGPVDLPNMPVNEENVVERLGHLAAVLADPSQPSTERAVGAAWLLHLAGDVHQPLHCSTRVTARDPDGDRGGNEFELRGQSLHAYWDGMLDKAVQRRSDEGTGAYLDRAAGLVVARHPRILMEGQLKLGKFEDWARESLVAAKEAYPATLRRGQEPSGSYRQQAVRVGMERAALAAYRLAATLEELFGQ
jgi:S1/P1 Nuclease